MDNATMTLIVLAFVAFFFVTELLPLAVTAMAGAIACGVLGIIPMNTVFSGLSNSTVVLFAAMFVIGAAMAAVAGVLLGQFYGVINPYIGFMAGMKAFTAAVLGGIGSIPGAMIGGLILGIAEALSSAYLSTEYKDVVSFALLILVLLVMPTGILGRPEVEKV